MTLFDKTGLDNRRQIGFSFLIEQVSNPAKEGPDETGFFIFVDTFENFTVDLLLEELVYSKLYT